VASIPTFREIPTDVCGQIADFKTVSKHAEASRECASIMRANGRGKVNEI
jgi:hypothetical protein